MKTYKYGLRITYNGKTYVMSSHRSNSYEGIVKEQAWCQRHLNRQAIFEIVELDKEEN